MGVLVALWMAAAAAIGGVTWSFATSASAAAPANDAIAPTATNSQACLKGIAVERICLTDNAGVSYYMDSNGEYALEAADKSIVSTSAEVWDTYTDLTITLDNTPAFSGSAETDVIIQEGDFGYPDNFAGITWCDDPISTTRCDQHYIRMRGAGRINQLIATHEFGHAWGLHHPGFWAPARDDCYTGAAVMMRWTDCAGATGALSQVLVNNVNYIY